MKAIVLGFAGKIASGKSTISKEIAQYLGWNRVSFGDYVRTIAHSQGLNESREVLQAIGASLINEDIEKFCQSVLAQVDWKPGQPLVIDGIRHLEIVSMLNQIVAPLNFRLVFVSVNESIRESRLIERGLSDRQHQQNIEAHSTEAELHTELPTIADLIVDGMQNPEELVQEIINWMEKYK